MNYLEFLMKQNGIVIWVLLTKLIRKMRCKIAQGGFAFFSLFTASNFSKPSATIRI